MPNLIPKEFIGHLLERADIIDLISERITLKKQGGNFVGCCPFHNEKTPSFSVNPGRQFYHCFGCGASGDAISFLKEFDRLSFVEAVETLAKKAGVTVPNEMVSQTNRVATEVKGETFDLMEQINLFYQKQLLQNQTARDYLVKRGITTNVIERFGIGYAPEGWHQLESLFKNQRNPQKVRDLLISAGMLVSKEQGNPYDRFRHRIMFPIRNRRGKLIAFGGRAFGDDQPKYLNSPETVFFHKGSELYGLSEADRAIRAKDAVIIVEGYMDTVALAQFGIHHVAATLGTAATQEHLRRLLRYTPHIIFSFDGDNAGRKAAWRALENALSLLHAGIHIRFMFLPDGEDPDTLIRQEGAEAFLARADQAMDLSTFFIKHLTHQVDMGSVDGKARFTQLAKPLIGKITDEVYQQLLLQQISKLLRIDAERLDQLLGLRQNHNPSYQTRRHSGNYVNSNEAHSSPPKILGPTVTTRSPVRSAITLLLQNPKLGQCAIDISAMDQLSVRGMDLLRNMIELVKSRPHINTAAILEHYVDHPQGKALKKLVTWEINLSEEGVEKEFRDTLNYLQQQQIDLQIECLLNKANAEGLTADERNRLKQLIAEQHESRRE